MVAAFLKSLLVSLFTLHQQLYFPSFPTLVSPKPIAIVEPSSLTLPVTRLGSVSAPLLQSTAYMAIDQASGVELAARNADVQLFPASTTKMMTALIALDHYDLDTVLTVPENLPSEGSVMHLVAGEQIKVKDVLAGLLIHSSNDAANLLADQYPGGMSAFVAKMNEKAAAFHMAKTHYENPSGLYSSAHVTSVRDLLILAREAMQQPTFRSFVKEQHVVVKSVDGAIVHDLVTTNQLLGTVQGVEGIKTGWTEEAGECLVTQVTRDGHTVLIALLKSPDRFAETKKLLEWVYGNYHWETKAIDLW